MRALWLGLPFVLVLVGIVAWDWFAAPADDLRATSAECADFERRLAALRDGQADPYEEAESVLAFQVSECQRRAR